MDIIRDFITDKENIAIAKAARNVVSTDLWRANEEAQYVYTTDIVRFLETRAGCTTDEQALKIYKLTLMLAAYIGKVLTEKVNTIGYSISNAHYRWKIDTTRPLKCFYISRPNSELSFDFTAGTSNMPIKAELTRLPDNTSVDVALNISCRFPKVIKYNASLSELFNLIEVDIKVAEGGVERSYTTSIANLNLQTFSAPIKGLIDDVFRQ